MKLSLQTLPPGGLLSLLAWELRIALRPAARNIRVIGEFGSVLKALAVWHVLLSIPVLLIHFQHLPEPRFLFKATAMAAPVMLVMPLAALMSTTAVLLKASSWQLYLAAPLPWRRVVLLRCLQTLLMNWGLLGVILPFAVANACLLTGHPAGLALYPASLGLALFGAACGLLLLALLVLALGVRHARRAVLGLGALVVVASVALPGWLSLTRDSSHKAMIARDAARAAWWQANPVADWLSGALAAQWLPSLVVLAAGSLLFWLAVRVIAPTAWHIAITSDEPLRKAPAPGLVRRFAGGLPWLLTVKEWRAVLRNPAEWLGLLINIVLVVVGVKLFLKGSSTDVQLATSLVATIGLLAARLMPVFIGAEEAPTLLASAPVARNRLLLLKVNAALLPLAVLVLLASLTLLFGYGWQAALVGGVAALLAAFSTAVISVARPYRIQRKSFQSTGWPEGFKAADLLAQAVLQLAWPLLALVCLNGYWWAALGGAALLLVPLWSYWKDFETETILGY